MNDLTGQTIDTFFFHSHIGSGGMADVYKVWDPDRGVLLAVKVLKPELAGSQYLVQLFESEGKILAELQHPNIVRYYGSFQKMNLFYFVMDYIEGTTLRAEMKPGACLPFERILEVMSSVFTALGYAHRKGVIHCDIKPANLLIHKNGVVLLSDFGIARLVSEVENLTVAAGSPQYMAPEQVKDYKPTPQTDIYALGVILYEMVTGYRPYTGDRAIISGDLIDRLLWEKLNLDPAPIIPQNKMVSHELEDLILCCLEKDPLRRPRSVLDFLPHLQQAVFRLKSSNKKSHLYPTGGRNLPSGLKDCSYCKSEITKKMPGVQHSVKLERPFLRGIIWIIIVAIIGMFLLLQVIINSPATLPLPSLPISPPPTIEETLIPFSSIEPAFLYIPPGVKISETILVTLCSWENGDSSLDVFLSRPDGSQMATIPAGKFGLYNCESGMLPGYQFFINPTLGEQPGEWSITVTGYPSGITQAAQFQVFP